jgi:hypothetical protein
MSKRIHVSHAIGQVVYLRTDMEQLPRIITRMTIAQSGVEYQLRYSDRDPTWHQDVELMRSPKPQRSPGYK